MPANTAMPMANLQYYARAYVLDQPYIGVVPPEKAFKAGAVFPFLLDTYIDGLKRAEQKLK